MTLWHKALLPAALALSFAWPGHAQQASDWPQRQAITMILPAGAGGSSDPVARLLAEEMGKHLSQSIIVQNRPGAGGNIGMSQAAKAAPDGYHIVISWTGPLATNLALYKDVGYDPQKDFSPIGMIGCTPNVLAVSHELGPKNLKEFEEYAKSKKDKASYGTTGAGSSWHIAGEMLSREIDNSLIHIPYQTPGAALTDLLGGRLDAIFPVVPMTVPHVQAGKLAVLAVYSSERSKVLPEVPTTVEQGRADLISDTCFALLAPAGTDTLILDRLNNALNTTLANESTRGKLEAMGMQMREGAPADLGRYLATEIPRQAKLVAASGATPQ